MNWSIVHGPERIPVVLDAGTCLSPEAILPFHHIISRGLLIAAESRRLPPQQWPVVAPFLDQALGGIDRSAVPHLNNWLVLAKQCGVLPHTASARCALEFVRTHGVTIAGTLLEHPLDEASIESCELWSIKEGHTSSVWVATIALRATPQPIRFVVEVARDFEAGRELVDVATELGALGVRNPSRVVRVLGRSEIPLPAWNVPVIANTWIPEGFEIHVLRDGRAVAIERFASDPAEPARAASFAIRDGLQSDDLWAAMLLSWIALGDWRRPEGPVLLPNVQINEGDWVFTNGIATLCGVTPGTLMLSCRDALSACLTLSATADHSGPRITWANQDRAWTVVSEAAATGSFPALTHPQQK
jgi:hypothetical protein